MNNSNLYYELLGKPVFDIKYVTQYYNDEEAARSAIKRLLQSGQVLKIRNNMYTCSGGKDRAPVASRFQIASAVNASSFVSHHSAMEYYGVTDQVSYEVYVGSAHQFRDFEFDGYLFHCVLSRFAEGIEHPEFSGGISITDKERTVIDSIKDMDRISGIEEVIDNISSIGWLDEKRLVQYLELYNNQFLYQKTGFLLQHNAEGSGLSRQFFSFCHENIKKSKRYLTSDSGGRTHYDSEWQLVVPDNLYQLKNGEI